MSRRRLLRLFLVIITIAALFVLVEMVACFSNIILPWHRSSAINATLAWGGLAPFPDRATGLKIRTAGSAFTREFIATFKAPVEDIREWVKLSPGLTDNEPKKIGPNAHRYWVTGYGGAAGGWVDIDYETGLVHIDVSWS